MACGEAFYSADKVRNATARLHSQTGRLLTIHRQYTCYDGDFLCPILDGVPTLRCGEDCFLPYMYSCDGEGKLMYSSSPSNTAAAPAASSTSAYVAAMGSANNMSTSAGAICSDSASTLHLSDPPYENYFYSDCHGASQVVVTSPLPDSNLSIIGPRLLVAWPPGNSGVVAFFAPQSGVNGTLSIELVNGTSDQPLSPVYEQTNSTSGSDNPRVGISTLISFNSSAVLTIPIMGSIRTIRDFVEGPSLLVPEIQSATTLQLESGVAVYDRLWLSNETTTLMSFRSTEGSAGGLSLIDGSLYLEAGTYRFTASFDYRQLTQLSAMEVLNEESQGLIAQYPDQTKSLSFLSTSEKLLAGAWRFLTYFGKPYPHQLVLQVNVLQ
jgi:hypothetical protein